VVFNFAFMINNAFVKLERNKEGDIVRAFTITSRSFSDIVRAFTITSRNFSDIVYVRGSGHNRIWKSVNTPHGKDETEDIKIAVFNLLERMQEEELKTTVGKLVGSLQNPRQFIDALNGEGRVINIRTLIYTTMVNLAEQFVANPYQTFQITNPETGTLVDITEGLLKEMPGFFERELAACAWQAPIVEKIYCSKLMYGVENQAAIFNKEGNRFMSLLEFDVPGIVNWFKIIRKNPTINASSIFRTDKGFEEPQIIPHISPKSGVSVSMVTPTDALSMMGVDVEDIPYDSFTSGPLLMIFLALCFHELFSDESIIPALLASSRQFMLVETYNQDGFKINTERVVYEETFDRERLKENQAVVYSSPLNEYLTAWIPDQPQRIIAKFGGLVLR